MLIMATALSSGTRRLLHPLRRAEQAKLFARERRKQNAALELPFARREQPREFEHARGAGSVVVGAGMNLADLRRRKRIDIAVTEMIVVRADDDVLVGLAGKIGQHIVHGGARRSRY